MIALLMSVTFLFPVMSWAFEVQSYTAKASTASEPSVAVTGGVRIPDALGRVTGADVKSNGMTLFLIQDLHCNAEIQNNIHGIITALRKQKPGIAVVAVEGASGTIPTQELALLPNTQTKAAVIDYFVREGRLTGADSAAIWDQTDVELYGAEDSDLYNRSLALIDQFATEENRALIEELADKIRYLRARRFNPVLLAFERRREDVAAGRLDSEDYHRALLQAANRMRVSPFSPETSPQAFTRPMDFQDHLAQDQYLENAIRQRLFKNDAEKRLFARQRFVELAGSILAVSASRSIVEEYQRLSREDSLAKVQREIGAELKKMNFQAADSSLVKETAGLETAVQKGLEFYQLAEQRNQTLFQRAEQRARTRGGQALILVAGGYHTQGIARLATRQGFSWVSIRPRQVLPDTSTAYYQLLQNPNQATDLEEIVARISGSPSAIAVRNFLAFGSENVRKAVDTVAEAAAVLQGKAVARSSAMAKVSRDTVRVKVDQARTAYLTLKNGKLNISNTFKPQTWNRPGIRTLGLISIGVGVTAALGVVAGLAVPVYIVAAPLLLGAGLLAVSTPAGLNSVKLTRRNVIIAALIVGTLLFLAFGLPLLGVHITQSAGVVQPLFNHFNGLIAAVKPVIGSLGLPNVQAYPSVLASQVTQHTTLATGSTLQGPTFTFPVFMAGIALRGKVPPLDRLSKSSESILGKDYLSKLGDALLSQLNSQFESDLGLQLRPDQERPVAGSQVLISDEKIAEIMHAIGTQLPHFEDNKVIVEFFHSKPVPLFDAELETKEAGKIRITEYRTPINSNLFFQSSGERAELFFRVNVIDPEISEAELSKYSEGVLNTLNPFLSFKASYPTLRDKKMGLFESEQNRQFFDAMLKEVAANALKNQAKYPKDTETLIELLPFVILHEINHALITHMPDKVLSSLSAEENERRLAFGYTNYRDRLLNSQDPDSKSVLLSDLAFKNVIKAINLGRPGSMDADTILAFTIETFCDRFSIYLYENYCKMKVCQKYFKEIFDGLEVPMSFVYQIQDLLDADDMTGLQSKYPFLSQEDKIAKLKEEFSQAERTHIFIRKYNNPPITKWERDEFFRPFLEFLQELDRAKRIGTHSKEHFDVSQVIFAHLPNGLMAGSKPSHQFGMNAAEVLEEAARNEDAYLQGPLAVLSESMGKKIMTGQKFENTAIDTEFENKTLPAAESEVDPDDLSTASVGDLGNFTLNTDTKEAKETGKSSNKTAVESNDLVIGSDFGQNSMPAVEVMEEAEDLSVDLGKGLQDFSVAMAEGTDTAKKEQVTVKINADFNKGTESDTSVSSANNQQQIISSSAQFTKATASLPSLADSANPALPLAMNLAAEDMNAIPVPPPHPPVALSGTMPLQFTVSYGLEVLTAVPGGLSGLGNGSVNSFLNLVRQTQTAMNGLQNQLSQTQQSLLNDLGKLVNAGTPQITAILQAQQALYQNLANTNDENLQALMNLLDQQYQYAQALNTAQNLETIQGLKKVVKTLLDRGESAVTLRLDPEVLKQVATASLTTGQVGMVVGDPSLTPTEAANSLEVVKGVLEANGYQARVVWPETKERARKEKSTPASERAALRASLTPRLEYWKGERPQGLPGETVEVPAQRIVAQNRAKNHNLYFSQKSLLEELAPLPKTTEFASQKGLLRAVSGMVLFFAESIILMRAVVGNTQITVRSGFRGWQLPVISMVSQNSFWNALRIMGILLFGRLGDLEKTIDPQVAQQLQEFVPNLREQIRDLALVTPQLRLFEAAKLGNRKEKFKYDEKTVPLSLRYTLRQLVWLVNLILEMPLFSRVLNAMGFKVTQMLPELLVIVNAFTLLESINWRISPTAYMQREIQVVQEGTLSPALVQDLNNSRQFRNDLAAIENNPSQARIELMVSHLFRLIARRKSDSLEDRDYRMSVLRVVSMVDPSRQTVVELRGIDAENRALKTFIRIPSVVMEDPWLLDYMLTVLERSPEGFALYDRQGNSIDHPARRGQFNTSA